MLVSALVLTGATWAWWTRRMEPQEFQARIDRGRVKRRRFYHGPNDVHVRHNERHIPGFLVQQPAPRPLARHARERAARAYVGCARDRCCTEGLAPVVDARDFSPVGNPPRSFPCRSPERLDVAACHGSFRRLQASRPGAMVVVQPAEHTNCRDRDAEPARTARGEMSSRLGRLGGRAKNNRDAGAPFFASPLRRLAARIDAATSDLWIRSPGAIATKELEKGCASAPQLALVPVLYASQCVIDEGSTAANSLKPRVRGLPLAPTTAAAKGPRTKRIADRSKYLANVDAIESALASALAAAAAAGRFDMVAQLVREIEARRLARAGHAALVD